MQSDHMVNRDRGVRRAWVQFFIIDGIGLLLPWLWHDSVAIVLYMACLCLASWLAALDYWKLSDRASRATGLGREASGWLTMATDTPSAFLAAILAVIFEVIPTSPAVII